MRLVIFATLALTGCSIIIDPSEEPLRCDPDVENVCGSGRFCDLVDGVHRCVAVECDKSEDCGSGYICFDHTCLEADCSGHEECELGYICDEGYCVPGCTGPERCAAGQVCFEGFCRDPQVEICNGVDDDFDGEIDEGFDADEDGWSSCEHISQPPDCNDSSPYARPGLTELCDGLDNDCDGPVDEETCPFGQTCVPGTGCLNVGTCIEDVDCEDAGDGLLCGPDGRCVEPAAFGEPCTFDRQCLSGSCLETGLIGVPGRRCTDYCCSTQDCDERSPGSYCADNGSGLRFCATSGWFESDTVECGGPECQVCARRDDSTLVCADDDLCCGNAHHGSGTCERGCQLVAGRTPATTGVEDVVLMVCDVRSGRRLFEMVYADETLWGVKCNSGLSWNIERDFILGRWDTQCSAPCCDDSDCVEGGTTGQCVLTPDLGFPACYDASTVPEDMVWLGTRGYGNGACGGLADWESCASGVCHPEGYCTEACCPGSECPDDPMGREYGCRPQLVGGSRWIHLCTRLDS